MEPQSVLLESLNPGDKFKFCFQSGGFFTYQRCGEVGKFIEVKQVTPTVKEPELYHPDTLVIKL